jgi:hypothetical protein
MNQISAHCNSFQVTATYRLLVRWYQLSKILISNIQWWATYFQRVAALPYFHYW